MHGNQDIGRLGYLGHWAIWGDWAIGPRAIGLLGYWAMDYWTIGLSGYVPRAMGHGPLGHGLWATGYVP